MNAIDPISTMRPGAARGLAPGAAAPWFVAPTHSNPAYGFDTAGGRYLVVAFLGRAGSDAGRAVLAFVAANRDRFDDRNLAFFGVTGDPADHGGALVEQVPGVRWFLDRDGAIARAFGTGSGPLDAEPTAFVIDPAMRILERVPLLPAIVYRGVLERVIRALPPVAAWSAGPAPVLTVARVLEPAFCRRLIAYYEANGGSRSGHMVATGGRSVGVVDRNRKRRFDCHIADEGLRAELRRHIVANLFPMIERSLQFRPTRIERDIVARYDGAEGGFFLPHRDNTTPATRHRRFAVTINLNAEDYEGGDLRFPEFGQATHRAPTGGAAVFSCSLLHEALPVTRGVRYATLPFLYDDAAAKLRAATSHLITGRASAE